MKLLANLIKFKITLSISAIYAIFYFVLFSFLDQFDKENFVKSVLGVCFLVAGSQIIKQLQTYKLDQQINSDLTHLPIAKGKITPAAGAILGISFVFAGMQLLAESSQNEWLLGLMGLIAYNLGYLIFWKRFSAKKAK